ncbi:MULTISPECIES: DUF6602 domain-containing protein [Clostridia]|uniref:DUF6602 domain-containing protein n=1 Tax=Clostridia TaxID=186801 RepID=UPI000EA2F697|nr:MULTISPECIES: DUF6602 domain-containing protein [Clostridia]NBJ68375.1 hypothetical protein [Roseburia sp. 1XD42-34]RKI81463.1 hypothetical protein D7V87_02645 [Clostridium sp. 1xD42-85]
MSNTNDVVQHLIHNYQHEETSIASQLYFKHKHDLTIGTFREQIWQELFEGIVPKKFVVEQSIFIIDTKGTVSKEVDLAIIDEMYTPYIFRKGQLKFIPIEAVAVAIQCKSVSAPTHCDLKDWVNSIKKLKTAPNGIARMAMNIADTPVGTQKSTRPILIYCHLGKSQPKNHSLFDFSICATEEHTLEIKVNPKFKELNDIYLSLNFHEYKNPDCDENLKSLKADKDTIQLKHNNSIEEYRVTNKQEEVSLLSLNFMLNQALMLLNNPMLFPHKAYVEMFNREGDE